MNRSLVVLSALLLAASSLLARTWHILADGSGDAPTIQAGIDSAAGSDTVLVHHGTYTGLGNKDLDFHGKNLVVRSQNGPEVTIIDCEGSGRGFDLETGAAANRYEIPVVEGFTVRNGSAEGGGAIRITGLSQSDDSYIKVIDCRLHENAAFSGGGMLVTGRVVAYLRRVVAQGNIASGTGGGIFLEGEFCRAWVESCAAVGNAAAGDAARGGGVATDGAGWLILGHSTIAGNRSTGEGGGLAILGESSGPIDLNASVIWGNCAAGSGNQIHWEAPYDGNVCCIDTSGGEPLAFCYGCFHSDPLFCAPEECLSAPTTDGDYRLDHASPCLPANNLWGVQIGGFGEGCDIYTAVATGPAGRLSERVLAVSPNPGGGAFTIRYGLAASGPSTIQVFDIAGRLVRVLAAPGTEGNALWDGKDASGRDAAPGVYFVRVSERTFIDTKRVILVR
ncbi:MAG: T9SS type A sorting domain-containing protein [Candidatus Eisenbacteria bacterium]